MKKVIDGKVYNTETAVMIADWSNGCNYGDFDRCEETLYKSKKGAYFISGSGGARSKYGRACGSNTWTGGSDIEPVSREDAFHWCESHNVDANIIAKEFPDMIEEA